MKTEKGVIAAVFNDKGRVLVLKRTKNWEGWELLKGHLEQDYEQTVLQELEEEAGIDPELVDAIKELDIELNWEYTQDGEEFEKQYRAYAVKVSGEPNIDTSKNPHDEHEHGFFLRPRHVEAMLEYENNQKVLEKALELELN